MIRFLVETGADLNAAGYVGWTPLHAAASSGLPEWVELLCERGANPLAEADGQSSTMLSACCQPPSPEKLRIIDYLAKRGVSIDLGSKYGETPLSVTLWFGDCDAFRALLKMGADAAPLQWTELHARIMLGSCQDVVAYSRTALEVDQPDGRWGLTPLHWAAKTGELAKVKYLAERGAILNQKGRFGTTALHIAAGLDRVEVVKWFLSQGVNPESQDDFPSTPLISACQWDAVRSVRALLEAGATQTPKSHEEEHAISSARSLEVLTILVGKGGADVNQISGQGSWPLKDAAEDNDVERCEWLLSHGAEVDRSSTGETALHSAVQMDSREVARLLLERGANPNTQDVDGWTPLFRAKSREAIQMLLHNGADPTLQDQVGSTAEKWLSDPLWRELI